MRQITRDPFARATFQRETVPQHERGECRWCGRPAKYRYWWEPDQLRSFIRRDSSLFCSARCFRSYNG